MANRSADREAETPPHAPGLNPQRIMQFLWGHAMTQVMITAIELDLFTRIQGGTHTIEALAHQTGASARGVRIVVDVLVSVGLVHRHGSTLSLPAESAAFLTKTSPSFIGGVIKPTQQGWNDWGDFREAVHLGRSPHARVHTNDRGDWFATWVDGLYNLNHAAAQAVAAQVAAGAKDALDLGAGSAVWSLASAQSNPDLQVAVIDHPSVIDKVTKGFAERLGVSERYTWRPGSFRDLDLGHETFDLIFLGHILHGEGERRSVELLKRCHQALRPAGTAVVAEMVADNERSTNPGALIFAANMLLFTEEGDSFSASQLELMGKLAGFSSHAWLEVPAPNPILLLKK
ncbi:MAG TPA: methyltransferase [Candidatus Xenobia bacterium]